MMHGYRYGGYGMFEGGILSNILMLAFMGLIIWTVISIISRLVGGTPKNSSENEVTRILESRYANGEITKEQYKEIKKNIKN